MTLEQKDKKLFVSTLLLVLIHTAGFIGLHSGYRELFLRFTPANLLLSALLLFINHKEFNKSFYVFCFLIFSASFFIEVLGVKTGYIFGSYAYGSTLGYGIAGVPIVIGINWLMLIYSVGIICDRLNTGIVLKSITGAILLVILDYVIEPIALKFDFWLWPNNIIPVQNYIAWFLISFLFLIVFYGYSFKKDNKIAKSLYIIQLVFFILLGTF